MSTHDGGELSDNELSDDGELSDNGEQSDNGELSDDGELSDNGKLRIPDDGLSTIAKQSIESSFADLNPIVCSDTGRSEAGLLCSNPIECNFTA